MAFFGKIFDRVAQSLGDRRQGLPVGRQGEQRSRAALNHASKFTIEPLEPRLLLSGEVVPQPIPNTVTEEPNSPAPLVLNQEPANEITVSREGWAEDQPGDQGPLTVDDRTVDSTRPSTLDPLSLLPQTDGSGLNGLSVLNDLKNEAIDRLSSLGFSEDQIETVRGVEVNFADLPGWQLASTGADGVTLDRDAAGYGWFIDQSPSDDSEFTQQDTELLARDGSPAQDRIDLLSVLAHELGHYLGRGHTNLTADGGPWTESQGPLTAELSPVSGPRSSVDLSSSVDLLMQSGIRPGVRWIAAVDTEQQRSTVPGRPSSISSITDQLIETLRVANGPPLSANLTITPTISWNLDTDGFWDVASNWLDITGVSRVPTTTDDVLIDRGAANPAITLRSGTQAARSLLSNESFVVSGGTLTLGNDSEINANVTLGGGVLAINQSLRFSKDITLSGGTIQGGTVSASGGAGLRVMNLSIGTLDAVTLDADVTLGPSALTTLTVRNGLTLANGHRVLLGPGTLSFTGNSQTLDGNGEVVFSGTFGTSTLRSSLNAGQTLTIGSGITVHSGTVGGSGTIQANTAILNQGTIAADAAGRTVTVTGASWSNAGLMEATGGTLTLVGSSLVDIGTVRLISGTLSLAGTFSTAQLGGLENSGCTLELSGTLNNAGATLALDATTGTLNLNGGTIVGGTVSASGGAGLRVMNLSIGTLDADVTLGPSALTTLTVQNGLTLANGHRVLLGPGTLSFTGNSQTLDGNGEVVFSGTFGTSTLRSSLNAGQTLTIGSGITVHSGTVGGSGTIQANTAILNQGTIAADAAGRTVTVTGSSFTNQGVLRSNGGALDIDASLRVDEFGIITGAPSSATFVSRNLLGDTRNADLFGALAEVRFDGFATVAAPQLLEAMSRDLGTDPAAFSHNFAYSTLALSNSTYLRINDLSDNAGGSGTEAIYTNSLIVPAGTTLDLNGHNMYTRAAQIGGTIIGGSITQIADSGALNIDSPTPGALSIAGERDEWTFFARGGQTVTVAVDTGTSAVLTPRVSWAQVDLVDANNVVIATRSSTAAGQIVTIDAAAIPADGSYRVRIKAPANQLAATGNYLVTAWNVTPDIYSLLLNQQVTGYIENPFSIDQWHFSASAGTQLRFDLVNRANSSVVFDLTGPVGWIGFSNLGTDSDLLNLPSAGTYTLTAHGTGGSFGGAYTFRLQQTQVTNLALGVTYNGQFVGSGQAQLFRIDMPASNPLEVVLDDSASNNSNEVYLKFGAPPTRSDYDYRFSAPATSDQQILVPMAYAGHWYDWSTVTRSGPPAASRSPPTVRASRSTASPPTVTRLGPPPPSTSPAAGSTRLRPSSWWRPIQASCRPSRPW